MFFAACKRSSGMHLSAYEAFHRISRLIARVLKSKLSITDAPRSVTDEQSSSV